MENFKVRKWMNSSTMNLLFILHFFITQVQRQSLLWEEVRVPLQGEILRHKTVEKVVMCDIDEEVVDFCKAHLDVNREAFCDPRLDVIINDARTELEIGKECYDVIIGDLADPIEGGPCYKLYTKSFYEHSVKPKLNRGGIFVTQAGPAGIFSHTEVFSCILQHFKAGVQICGGLLSSYPFLC
uniref:PABS domain-containing protein n=1 Tax=Salix viminalis TaxID=40686 RepID=A0A6N2NF84_SALVM